MFIIFLVSLLSNYIHPNAAESCGQLTFTRNRNNDVGPKGSYSGRYDNQLRCHYKIRPTKWENGLMTVLESHSFDIQDNMPHCNYDSITCSTMYFISTLVQINIFYFKTFCFI